MERLLFFEMSLGFLGLTVFLLTAMLGFDLALVKSFWIETLLSGLLWLTFLLLLIGHYALKWRSATAAMWASLGVAVAIILYLTSHLR